MITRKHIFVHIRAASHIAQSVYCAILFIKSTFRDVHKRTGYHNQMHQIYIRFYVSHSSTTYITLYGSMPIDDCTMYVRPCDGECDREQKNEIENLAPLKRCTGCMDVVHCRTRDNLTKFQMRDEREKTGETKQMLLLPRLRICTAYIFV